MMPPDIKLKIGSATTSSWASRIAEAGTDALTREKTTLGHLPRILLVEDEKPVRDIVVPMLFSGGFDCREAADGRAAMDLLRSGTRINLVLSNLLLPVVDGWSLFMHVKGQYPKIPFAFVTAIQDAEIRRKAMKEGAADYLNKPFTCAELLTMVRRVLQERSG